jgi:hypothetical protein
MTLHLKFYAAASPRNALPSIVDFFYAAVAFVATHCYNLPGEHSIARREKIGLDVQACCAEAICWRQGILLRKTFGNGGIVLRKIVPAG